MSPDRLARLARGRTGAAATLAALALGAGVLVGAERWAGAERPDTPPREALVVRTVSVARRGHHAVRRAFVGRIEPRRQSAVGFDLSGELAAVTVEEGERVERGQRLAALDTQRLRAERAELRAAAAEARAEAELAAVTLDRVRGAHGNDAASEHELDTARKRVAARRAAHRRAKRRIERVDVELAKSRLRAPFDAVVARRHLDPGHVVQAGEPVLRVLERAAPEARIGVPAAMAAALEAGDALRVRVRGRGHDAKVARILPTTERATRSVDLVLALDAPADGLRAGDLARTRLKRRVEEAGFWLPLSALTASHRGLWACYVAEPGGPAAGGATHELVRRPIELLHAARGRAFVSGPVPDGARVVAEGLHRVVAGQPVVLAKGEGGAP